MGEMTDALGGRLAHLVAQIGPGAGPMVLLAACVAMWMLARGVRPMLSRATATLFEVSALTAALAALAASVHAGGLTVAVDDAVTRWLVAHRDGVGGVVAAVVTDAFDPVPALLAAAAVALVAARRFRSMSAGLIVVATVGGAYVMAMGVKLLVARDRPPLGTQLLAETGYSFPSGHVTTACALCAMAVVVTRRPGRAAVLRACVVAGATVGVAAVAWSRLYLGVHWLSDTVAGVLLAGAVVTLGSAYLQRHACAAPVPPARGASEATALVSR